MTDEAAKQLLQLVAQGGSNVDEIQLFCDRLVECEQFRQQLIGHPEHETHLLAVLSWVGVSLESLQQRVELRRRMEIQRRGRLGAWTIIGLGFMTLLAGTGVHLVRQSLDEGFVEHPAQAHESSKHQTSVTDGNKDSPDVVSTPGKTASVHVEASEPQPEIAPGEPKPVSQPIAASGPWNAALKGDRLPFEVAWARPIGGGTSPSIAQLEEWFQPVAGHEARFISEQYRSQPVAGFEGTVKLRAPLDRDAALRLSVPDHLDLRLYLYHGSEGLLIQQNDSNNRASSRLHDLELQLARAKEAVAAANADLKAKGDAAKGPLNSIQNEEKAVDSAKANVVKAKEKLPEAAKVKKQRQADARAAMTKRKAALRDVPRASLRVRDADRRVRLAQTAARKKPDDKGLKQRIEEARKRVKEAIDAQKIATRTKTETERAWQTAERNKRNAEQAERVLSHKVRIAEHQVKAAEHRLRNAHTRAKRWLDEQSASKKIYDEAQAAVARITAQTQQAKQAAVEEAANSGSDPNAWTAWTIAREDGDVIPRTKAIVAADGGRSESTELRRSTEFELRYSEGRIRVTRGDVVLLAAPMPHPPSEVYVSGRLLIDRIGMVRTTPVDQSSPPTCETDLVASTNPADLNWEAIPSAGAITKLPDGITVSNDLAAGPASASATFSNDSEVVIFSVEATPGSSLTLLDQDNEHIGRLAYLSDEQTSELMVEWEPGGTSSKESAPRRYHIAPSHSVRLLSGIESHKVWLGDGQGNWSSIHPQVTSDLGRVSGVRLSCESDTEAARISLRGIEHHRLRWLNAIADNAAPSSLSEAAFDRLLSEPKVRAWSTRHQFALLNEFSLLSDLRSDSAKLNRMVERYHRVAEHGAERRDARPFSELRRALMSAPLWTRQQVSAVHEPLLRREMLNLAIYERWADVDQLCRELAFFGIEIDFPLSRWAKGMVALKLPASAIDPLATLPDDWRQPLVYDVDKELYSQMAEFKAAVSGASYKDALKVAMSVRPDQMSQLVPTANGVGERRESGLLLQSIESALAGALHRHADFNEYIDQEFSPKAMLRVQQAIATGDATQVSEAVSRSFGTPAAVTGRLWLGDRDLSLGNFESAREHFRLADTGSKHQDYSARVALASAMLGRKVAHSARSLVRFNDSEITSSDFDAVLDGLVEERGNQSPPAAEIRETSTTASGEVHPPLRLHARSDLGEIEPVTFRHFTQNNQVDSFRRLGITSDESHLYINSGCKLSALDFADGRIAWSSNPTRPGEVASPPAGMKPLVAGQFVFARHWDSGGPSLVCYRKTSGEKLWARSSTPNEVLVSDPMIGDGKLQLLVARKKDAGDTALSLASLDAATGRETARHDLVQLDPFWRRRQLCCIKPLDDSFVASLGGVVLHATHAGDVRWVRTQLALPAEVDPEWITQDCNSTFLDEDNLYVTQPGVRQLECLDRASGTSRWSRVLPGVRRIIGLCGPNVVVMNDDRIESFNRKSGEPAWTLEADSSSGVIAGHCTSSQFVCARVKTQKTSGEHAVEFVWLDSNNGREIARASLDSLTRSDLKFGSLTVVRNRLVFARGKQDAGIELIQLTGE